MIKELSQTTKAYWRPQIKMHANPSPAGGQIAVIYPGGMAAYKLIFASKIFAKTKIIVLWKNTLFIENKKDSIRLLFFNYNRCYQNKPNYSEYSFVNYKKDHISKKQALH